MATTMPRLPQPGEYPPGYDARMATLHPAVTPHPDGAVVAVWAVAGARRPGIFGEHDGALRVKVAAPAEAGKANRAIARMLCTATGATSAELERGARQRRKRFVLMGVDAETVTAALRR